MLYYTVARETVTLGCVKSDSRSDKTTFLHRNIRRQDIQSTYVV